MKIAALETIGLDEFPNALRARVRTDEGLTGLGETFFGARAVEAWMRESAAMTVHRPGPLRHRTHRPGPHALYRLCGLRSRGPRPLRGGHRALGPLRQGDGTAGLPERDARRQVGVPRPAGVRRGPVAFMACVHLSLSVPNALAQESARAFYEVYDPVNIP